MPRDASNAPITELILGAEAEIGDGYGFVFTLELATKRLVFRLTTRDWLEVKKILEYLGDQFGFKLPELPSIGSFRPWDGLYAAKIKPFLAFSPNKPLYLEGGLELEKPLVIAIPELEITGVRVRYGQGSVASGDRGPGGGRSAEWDFGIDVKLFGREQALMYPFPVPAPKPPLFELRYFGLGQRVSPNLSGATTVGAVLDKMAADLRQESPEKTLETLVKYYRPDAGWLVGVSFSIRDLVDLKIIFNDPVLYGVALVAGKKLKALEGLKFEILYQRISDEVGVFYLDLTLPLAFREIFVGNVSITLPSIAVWIYTNGDFKVSLGWPLGERSFTVQVFPFIGGGGFYVAKLSSATSPDVPPGRNFNPVIAFGIALRLGVGKEFNKGILSASLSLSLYGVFEGRMAWEAGSGAQLPASLAPNLPVRAATALEQRAAQRALVDYFWFRGTFGIVGILQGAVDFAIIKASVSVRIEASVTVTFETGAPTRILVYAGVRVTLRVVIGGFKIFGVRIEIAIELSFHADITAEFVIDNSGAQLALAAAAERAAPLAWTPLAVFPMQVRPVLPLTLLPQVTRVEGQACFVAGLTIPTKPVGGAEWSPFEAFARAVAKWQGLLQARADGAAEDWDLLTPDRLVVWHARLERSRYLNTRRFREDALTYPKIRQFMEENFILQIETAAAQTGDPIPSAVFPMVPELVLRVLGGTDGPRTVYFDRMNRRDDLFVERLRAYYDEMRLGFAGADGDLVAALDDDGTPMVTLVIEDYFAALIKELRAEMEHAVREAHAPLRLDEALAAIDYETLAAKVSRFLQSGLRPPDETIPEDRAQWPTLAQAALYAQTGQQFPMYVGEADYTVRLEVPEAVAGWVTVGPAGAAYALPRDDASGRQALRDFEQLPLDPQVTGRAWLDPLAGRPLRLALKDLTEWTDRTGESGPRRLIAAVSAPLAALLPETGLGVGLFGAAWRQGEPDPPRLPYRPAVRVDLTLTRVSQARAAGAVTPEGGADEWVPHLYQLGGADERNRRVLEALLAGDRVDRVEAIELLYPAATDLPGLASRAPAASVLLVKTNLSTESNPRELRRALKALAGAESDPVRASLADRRAFLTLVWQAGVVNSGGFYLYYAAQDGKDLPEELFEAGPETPFSLLMTFAGGTDAAVFPFQNALVVDEPARVSLEEDTGRTLYVQPDGVIDWDAAQPAGSVGFTVKRTNPNHALTLPAGLVAEESSGLTREQVIAALRAGGIAAGSEEEARLLEAAGEANAQLENLFNLIQFRVSSGSGFRESVWSVPAGPGEPTTAPDAARRYRELRASGVREEPAEWLYQETPSVFRFASANVGSADPNRYAGVGGRIRLQFRVLDMFGNVMEEQRDPVALPAVDVRYYDRLQAPDAWPGVAVDYEIVAADGAPHLVVALRFAPGAVVPGAGQGEGPSKSQADAATAGRIAWGRVYDQLRDTHVLTEVWTSLAADAVFTPERERLVRFARDVRDWLSGVREGLPWPPVLPAGLTLDWPLEAARLAAETAPAFRVTVELRMRRDAFVDERTAAANPAAARITMPIAPNVQAADPTAERSDPPGGLVEFAARFEAAFDGRLRLATGADTGEIDDGSPADVELWAVRLGAAAGVTLEPRDERSYFAPPPLSRALLTGRFEVRDYPQDGPWTGEPSDFTTREVLFADVDLDAWAATFLTDFDAVLAPGFAMPAAQVAGERFDELMRYKDRVAQAISDRVIPIFEGTGGDLPAATEAMYQRLLIRLAAAYEVSTIVQLPVRVTLSGVEVPADDDPRFFGAVGVAPATARALGAATGPDAQFTPARLSLRPPGGEASSFERPLTFLFTAARPTERAHFTERLRWTIGFMEQRAVSGAKIRDPRRYLPSSWLRFVRTGTAEHPMPELAVELGDFDVPIPLRRYPALPRLERQWASAERVSAAADALRWSYGLSWTEEGAAQDRLELTAEYNVEPAAAARSAKLAAGEPRPKPTSMLEALARYVYEIHAVRRHFADVVAAAAGEGDLAAARVTLERLAELIGGVAELWGVDPPATSLSATLDRIEERYWLEAELDQALLWVRRWARESGGGVVWPVWPDVAGFTPDPATPVRGDDAYEERLYRADSPVPGDDPAQVDRTVGFGERSLATMQNATSNLRVVRNAHLGERPTDARFVYETPAVSFANAVTPFIEGGGFSLDDQAGSDLSAKLGSFFRSALVGGVVAAEVTPDRSQRLIRVEAGYRYLLGGGLPVSLPVFLLDDYLFETDRDWDPALPDSLVRRVTDALGAWYGRTGPATDGAELVFGLTMFANFTTPKLPVLRLTDLSLTASADPAWWK